MASYRHRLPQLGTRLFLTDSGLETTLIFHRHLELPEFAAFPLLRQEEGRDHLYRYFAQHAVIAVRHRAGLILESVTWRANSDWGQRLGYSAPELRDANREAIELLAQVRDRYGTEHSPMVISGCVGPRGDGYDAGATMTVAQSREYHRQQIEAIADTRADMISALTMTSPAEATGVAMAARDVDIPAAISFTLETDGRLPAGQTLAEAIEATDEATSGFPAYYMINCAHPTHFASVLEQASGATWLTRLRGIRANASCKSHAELDEATELDDGDPVELGQQYARLMELLPNLNILGGCCGTDHRHIEHIVAACERPRE